MVVRLWEEKKKVYERRCVKWDLKEGGLAWSVYPAGASEWCAALGSSNHRYHFVFLWATVVVHYSLLGSEILSEFQ